MTRIYLGYNSAVEFLFSDLRGSFDLIAPELSSPNCMSETGRLLVLPPKKDAGSKGTGREME
jgi:hypothetical protein